MPSPELPPYLDTTADITAADTKELWRTLQDIPNQIERAEAEFAALKLPSEWSEVSQVVFCGMGGSAIGAEVASDLPAEMLRKPISLVRDYDLPASAGADSLVVVASYSGDTEEALACWLEAQARQCPVLAITGGGKLAELAHATPLYRFNYVAPPRDSFGYLFAPLVQVLVTTKVLKVAEADLGPAVAELKKLTATFLPTVPTKANRAKQLAYLLFDRLPLIMGSSLTKGVARRWKNQLNEHAKLASFAEPLPEANHNTVEGLELPARFKDDVIVLLLTTNWDNTEIKKRQHILSDYLKRRGLTHEVLAGSGPDLWAAKLSLLTLGDWVSYYLALLERVDPDAIPAIKALKTALRFGQ